MDSRDLNIGPARLFALSGKLQYGGGELDHKTNINISDDPAAKKKAPPGGARLNIYVRDIY
jgi:hypothetical protein